MGDAMLGYQTAIAAASPHATGVFTWPGFSYLQHPIVYTFTDGHASSTGGDWNLACYALWAAGTILAGRLWRLRALLHAQALLSGPAADVASIEDDRRRMAGRRPR